MVEYLVVVGYSELINNEKEINKNNRGPWGRDIYKITENGVSIISTNEKELLKMIDHVYEIDDRVFIRKLSHVLQHTIQYNTDVPVSVFDYYMDKFIELYPTYNKLTLVHKLQIRSEKIMDYIKDLYGTIDNAKTDKEKLLFFLINDGAGRYEILINFGLSGEFITKALSSMYCNLKYQRHIRDKNKYSQFKSIKDYFMWNLVQKVCYDYFRGEKFSKKDFDEFNKLPGCLNTCGYGWKLSHAVQLFNIKNAYIELLVIDLESTIHMGAIKSKIARMDLEDNDILEAIRSCKNEKVKKAVVELSL